MAISDRFERDFLAAEKWSVRKEKEDEASDKRFRRDELAIEETDRKKTGRRKLLMDMYGWKLASNVGVKRREVARRAAREISDPEDRRWLANQVMEISKSMGWKKRRDMTKKGFLKRFGSKFMELPTAAWEGAVGIAEDYAGMGRGMVGKSNEQGDLEFTNLLEAAYQYGDPKQQNEDNIAFRALRGISHALPQVGVGAVAYKRGGAKLLAAQAGSQMFAPFREALVGEGVGPVKATAISALTAGIAGAIETAIPIPTTGKGGIARIGGEVAEEFATKIGLKGLGKKATVATGIYGAEALGELTEEGLQSAVERAGSLFGAAAEDKYDGRSLREIPKVALEAMRESAHIVLPLSLGGGTFHLAGRIQQQQAKAQIEQFAAQNKAPSRREWKRLGLPAEHGVKAPERLEAVKEMTKAWKELETPAPEVVPPEEGKLQQEVADFLAEEVGARKIGKEEPQGLVAGMSKKESDKAMKSPNPEYRRRKGAARDPEIEEETKWQRIKERIGKIGKAFVRSRIHIPQRGDKFAVVRDALRQKQNVPEAALGEALGTVRGEVGKLSQQQYELFNEFMLAKNQLRSLNMEHPEFLRLGFKSNEEVEARVAQLAPLVEATPLVKEAVLEKGRVAREFVEKLVKEKMIGEEALEDPESYLHQQVVVHKQLVKRGEREGPGRKKKSFMFERVKDVDAMRLSALRWVSKNAEEANALSQARLVSAKKFPDAPLPTNPRIRREWIREVRRASVLKEETLERSITELEAKSPAELGEEHDFETEFIVPEVTYLTDAITTLEFKRIDDAIIEEYDRFSEFDEKAREDAKAGIAKTTEQVAEDAGHEITTRKRITGRHVTTTRAIAEEYERQMNEMLGLTEEESDLAHGEMAEKITLPKEIMDQIREDEDANVPMWMNQITKEMMDSWKAYVLLNPMRFFGYNFRNAFGDVDVSVAGDPSILLEMTQAIRDLKTLGTVSEKKLHPDVQAMRQFGVTGSGRYGQEARGFTRDPGIGRLIKKTSGKRGGSMVGRAVGGYWDTARGVTQFREDILRASAFRQYLKLIRTGKLEHFGASRKGVVLAIQKRFGDEAAAAHMARNLLGDYGDLTVMGDYFRSHLMPFWAFTEINTKRYPRILMNAFASGKNRTATGAVLAKIIAARIGYLYGLQWIWNNVLAAAVYGGDPEEELSEFDRAMGHINTGRNPDGTVRTIRNMGALSELLETFGINEAISMLPKLKNGQADLSDVAREMAKSPGEKVIGALGPHIKAFPEVLGGKSPWPNPFGEWRTVARDEAAMNIFGLKDAYNALKGQAIGGGFRAREHWLQRWFMGVSDPRQNMRNEIIGLREDFLRSEGGGTKGSFPISIYRNARRAAENNDHEAFKEWRGDFVAEYGIEKGAKKFFSFLDHLDPISQKLTDDAEWRFEHKYLDDDQREKLRIAKEYSQELRVILAQWWVVGLKESS